MGCAHPVGAGKEEHQPHDTVTIGVGSSTGEVDTPTGGCYTLETVSDRKDDLRRQLNTVWRSAVSGFDTLREVVVRSSQAGRLRVDVALLAREKQQLLVKLGEQTLVLVDDGVIELPAAARETLDRIRAIERRLAAETVRAQDNAYGAPRGYEPEASNYVDDSDVDEHAQVAEVKPRKRRAPHKKGEQGNHR